MPRTLRSPLAVALTLALRFSLTAVRAAVEQLVEETNARGGVDGSKIRVGGKLATVLEAKLHPTVRSPLSHKRDDHLLSGPWYIYEYPNRKPELLDLVTPAYLPKYKQ